MFKLMENYIFAFNSEMLVDLEFIKKQHLLQGLAGAGTAQVISKCVSFMDHDKCYLEVGIYQAANFIMVSSKNKDKSCFGVDSFEQDFIENSNFPDSSTIEVVNKRIKDYQCNNVKIFKSDFREFLKGRKDINGKKVEVYFFDGPHKLQDQLDGVQMVLPLLADEALIFVDDLASENVQSACRYLLQRYKELSLVKLLSGAINTREGFNQGQAVFVFKRNKNAKNS